MTSIEKNTAKLMQQKLQAKLDSLFAEQQAMNNNKGGTQFKKGGLVKAQDGRYQSISGNYGYGFGPWKQSGYNSSLSEIGQDPRVTTGFGYGWGQPYNGPAPVGQNTPVKTLYSPTNQYQGPVPAGGIHDPGVRYPMFKDPSWWNNIQAPDQQTNMATDPRFGTFSSVPEDITNISAANKVAPKGVAGTVSGQVAPSTTGKNTWAGNIGSMNQHLNDITSNFQLGPNKTEFGKANDVSSGLKGNGLAPAPNVSTTPQSGTNWGKVGTTAAALAPMIYNMFKGLQKPDKVKPTYNPYESQAMSLMADRRFNIDPLLNANRVGQAVNNRQIHDAAGSRGEMMGNLGMSQNARMAGDAAAYAQKNNMDNQYLAEQAQMLGNFGNNRSQMDWNVQDYNLKNKTATNQFLGQGFNDLGQWAQMQDLMNRQDITEAMKLEIARSMYGGSGSATKFYPGYQSILNSTKIG